MTNSETTIELKPFPWRWDLEQGRIYCCDIPWAGFWLNPSLYRMLEPLVREAGVPLFRLLVAHNASLGTDEDYTLITSRGSTFAEGFPDWAKVVEVCGWGRFELSAFDKEACRAVVVVRAPWELEMQRGSEVRWGCPFLQGKIIGLFCHALGVNCWADEVTSAPDAEATRVEFHVYRSDRTLEAEMARLRLAHREEAKRKLEERTQELRQNEAKQRAILASLSEVVFTLDEQARITSYHVPKEQTAFHEAPERALGRHVSEVMPQPIASLLLDAVAELARDDAPRTVNYAREHRGEVRFFSTKLSILREPVSGLSGVTAIEREITERMHAEQALTERLTLIQQQQEMIQVLSTPIIQVWDGVLALPLVGVIDSRRAAAITESLLQAIVSTQARAAILDLTGVEVVDTATADHFLRIIRAVELLGTVCLISGIRPAVAQTMVTLEATIGKARTFATVRSALKSVATSEK